MKQSGYLKIALFLWLIIGLNFNAECAKRKKLTVTVLDKETSAVIQKALVTVITLSNGVEIETDTKSTGKDGQCKFSLQIDSSFQFKVFAEKSDYFKCVKVAGKNNIVSEALISDFDDQVLILYLTLESQLPENKTSKPATKPVVNDRIDKIDTNDKKDKAVTEVKKTKPSPAVDEKEQPKPINQDVIKVEQPAADTLAETPPIQENTKESKGGSGFIWVLIIVVIVVGLTWIMKKRYDRKCHKCGKWNSMAIVNKEIEENQQSNMMKDLKTIDSGDRVLGTEEKAATATTIIYRIHRKCKKCGNEDSYKKKAKRKK